MSGILAYRFVLILLASMLFLDRFFDHCQLPLRGALVQQDKVQQDKPQKPVVYERGSCQVGTVGGNPSNHNYGAWGVCTNLLPPDPLVYSFGIGVDVSFDVAIVRDFGARAVFCYDPTIDKEYFAKISNGKDKNLLFSQLGAGASNDVIHFYKSKDPRIQSLVSTPGLSGYNIEPYLTAPVHEISSIAAINKHSWVDLIKLDIEGAEFDLLLQADLRLLPTSHILVEFHARMFEEGWDKQSQVYERFFAAGWELAYEQPKKKEETIFIRVTE